MDRGGLNDHLKVRSELENDSGGRWWTTYLVHGIQKVRGSNPLGSTKFLNTETPVKLQSRRVVRTKSGDGRLDQGLGAVEGWQVIRAGHEPEGPVVGGVMPLVNTRW